MTAIQELSEPEALSQGQAPGWSETASEVQAESRETLVVLPTFNERENLETIVASILASGHDVLIIDDNSPDGTGAVAEAIARSSDHVRVLHRERKLGLGSAYVRGFKHALENGYRCVVEMDADGSHQIAHLDRLIQTAKASNGLAIGSRYVKGGGALGWSAKRRLLSRAANIYCRLLLGMKINDCTSGFRCFTADCLKRLDLESTLADGFAFQIEMAFRLTQIGVPVEEVPIVFRERAFGKSKASNEEIVKALNCVSRLRRTIGHRTLSSSSTVGDLASVASIEHPVRSAVVGVLVHNEEATVEACLRSILKDNDEGNAELQSVVVVASGCTDRTEEIVARVAQRDRRVRLIIEPARSGKVAAINLVLRESSEPIVVIVGGDMVLTEGSLKRLLEPFRDPSVGMTGVRPIPTNPRSGVVGNAVNILWDVHHEVSLRRPKMGEAVAFRRIIQGFEPGTVFDEATMEHLVLKRGLRLQYVPQAIARNRGPETLRDYLRQRSRNIREHAALASATGHRVSTMDTLASSYAVWRLWRRGEKVRYLALTVALEALAFAQAHLSLLHGKPEKNVIWRPIVSSKRVIENGHVLRLHHDGFQQLRISRTQFGLSNGERTARILLSSVRRHIRRDDIVSLAPSGILLKIRTDENGARIAYSRLCETIPELSSAMGESSLIS